MSALEHLVEICTCSQQLQLVGNKCITIVTYIWVKFLIVILHCCQVHSNLWSATVHPHSLPTLLPDALKPLVSHCTSSYSSYTAARCTQTFGQPLHLLILFLHYCQVHSNHWSATVPPHTIPTLLPGALKPLVSHCTSSYSSYTAARCTQTFGQPLHLLILFLYCCQVHSNHWSATVPPHTLPTLLPDALKPLVSHFTSSYSSYTAARCTQTFGQPLYFLIIFLHCCQVHSNLWSATVPPHTLPTLLPSALKPLVSHCTSSYSSYTAARCTQTFGQPLHLLILFLHYCQVHSNHWSATVPPHTLPTLLPGALKPLVSHCTSLYSSYTAARCTQTIGQPLYLLILFLHCCQVHSNLWSATAPPYTLPTLLPGALKPLVSHCTSLYSSYTAARCTQTIGQPLYLLILFLHCCQVHSNLWSATAPPHTLPTLLPGALKPLVSHCTSLYSSYTAARCTQTIGQPLYLLILFLHCCQVHANLWSATVPPHTLPTLLPGALKPLVSHCTSLYSSYTAARCTQTIGQPLYLLILFLHCCQMHSNLWSATAPPHNLPTLLPGALKPLVSHCTSSYSSYTAARCTQTFGQPLSILILFLHCCQMHSNLWSATAPPHNLPTLLPGALKPLVSHCTSSYSSYTAARCTQTFGQPLHLLILFLHCCQMHSNLWSATVPPHTIPTLLPGALKPLVSHFTSSYYSYTAARCTQTFGQPLYLLILFLHCCQVHSNLWSATAPSHTIPTLLPDALKPLVSHCTSSYYSYTAARCTQTFGQPLHLLIL